MIKGFIKGLISQLGLLWKVLIVILVPVLLLFILVAALGKAVEHVPVAVFLRDVTSTAKLPFYTGFVSQLALMFWSAALAMCLFGVVALGSRSGEFASAKRLLLYGSVLTIVLLLDDSFLFHEEIAPQYLHINEKVVYAVYLIIGISGIVLNWQELLSSEYLLFFIALAMFGISIVLDEIPLPTMHVSYFVEQLEMLAEDGFKFAGIVTWLVYFARYAIQKFRQMGLKGNA